MDGKGTYTGSSGDTYRGSWVMNLKHGQGTKHFANGDDYEGEWRRGQQDGQGRYQWKNGNHYIGHSKNDVINGNGTLIWANGNRYDGCWKDRLPKGNGTFRWFDGSFYVSTCSTDPKEQSRTYYPSATSSAGNFDWDPQNVFSVDLSDCKICLSEKVSVLPSEKVLNWYGIENDFLQKQTTWKPKNVDAGGKPRRMLTVESIISAGIRGLIGYVFGKLIETLPVILLMQSNGRKRSGGLVGGSPG